MPTPKPKKEKIRILDEIYNKENSIEKIGVNAVLDQMDRAREAKERYKERFFRKGENREKRLLENG